MASKDPLQRWTTMAGRIEIDGIPTQTKVSLFQILWERLLLVLDFDVCMAVEFVCIHGIFTFHFLFFVFSFWVVCCWWVFCFQSWLRVRRSLMIFTRIDRSYVLDRRLIRTYDSALRVLWCTLEHRLQFALQLLLPLGFQCVDVVDYYLSFVWNGIGHVTNDWYIWCSCLNSVRMSWC